MSASSIRRTAQFALTSEDPFVRRLGEIILAQQEDLKAKSLELKAEKEEKQRFKRLAQDRLKEIGRLERSAAKKKSKNDQQAFSELEREVKNLREGERILLSRLSKAEAKTQKAEKNRTEVSSRNRKLSKKNSELKEQIAARDTKIALLKAELNRAEHSSSETSNIPSSFDIAGHSRQRAEKKQEAGKTKEETAAELKNKKRTPVSSRMPSGRSRGAQKGHPAHIRGLNPNPDRVDDRYVSKAPSGAVRVEDENGKFLYYAVQITELQTLQSTTEIRYHIISSSGAGTPAPEEMKMFGVNPMVYGPNVRAVAVYLLICAGLPYNRVVRVFSELTGKALDIKEGTVDAWAKKLADFSEEKNQEALERILNSKVVYCDETGIKVNGRQGWIHVIASDEDVYYLYSDKRSSRDKGPVKFLQDRGFAGTAVHDHFGTYKALTSAFHAECNVHIERYMRNGLRFDDCTECNEMLELYSWLRKRKEECTAQGLAGLEKAEYQSVWSQFVDICQRGKKRWEKTLKQLEGLDVKGLTPPYYSTFVRMEKNPEHYLRWLLDFDVPFSNNRAEQSVAIFKTKMKTARQCVTETGAAVIADLKTLAANVKKSDSTLTDLFEEMFRTELTFIEE